MMIFANSPINQVQIEKRGNIFSVDLSAEVYLAWNFIWNCPHIYFEASVSRELCVRMKMRRHIYLWLDQYRNVSKQQQKHPLDLHFTQTATWRILTLLKKTLWYFSHFHVLFLIFCCLLSGGQIFHFIGAGIQLPPCLHESRGGYHGDGVPLLTGALRNNALLNSAWGYPRTHPYTHTNP